MTEAPATPAPDAAPAAEGQAADTGQGSNPFASFEGDQLGYIQNKGWDKEGGINKLVDSYKSLESMRGVPEDRILLETDSPFLTPVPYRGKPNFPGNVSVIGQYIADLLKIPVLKFARIVRQNTINLFSGILNYGMSHIRT